MSRKPIQAMPPIVPKSDGSLMLEGQPLKAGYTCAAVMLTDDGLAHITYPWGHVKIKHMVLDPRGL